MFGNFSKSFKLGRRGLTAPYVDLPPDTTGTTEVSWTDNTYFDFYSSQTSTTTDILAGNQNRTLQLCFAHQALTIPNDAVSRVAVGTYSTQVASPKRTYTAIGIADNVKRFPATTTFITLDGTSNLTSSSGAFVEYPTNTAVTIPANRWFLIGHSIIPFRAARSMAAPRTATISGTYYFTVFPIIYLYGSQSETRTPTELGGYGVPFLKYTGYTNVMSIKFKL